MKDLLRRLLGLEWLLTGAAAPVLLFPTLRPAWTAAALGGLALWWLLRWALRREPWPVTPSTAHAPLRPDDPGGRLGFSFAELTLPGCGRAGVWASAVFRAVSDGG